MMEGFIWFLPALACAGMMIGMAVMMMRGHSSTESTHDHDSPQRTEAPDDRRADAR